MSVILCLNVFSVSSILNSFCKSASPAKPFPLIPFFSETSVSVSVSFSVSVSSSEPSVSGLSYCIPTCGTTSGSFLPHLFTFYFDRNSLGYEITQALVGGIASTYLAQSILYTMPPKHKLWFVSIPSICYLFLIFLTFLL